MLLENGEGRKMNSLQKVADGAWMRAVAIRVFVDAKRS
jgi:hypothetical protein